MIGAAEVSMPEKLKTSNLPVRAWYVSVSCPLKHMAAVFLVPLFAELVR